MEKPPPPPGGASQQGQNKGQQEDTHGPSLARIGTAGPQDQPGWLMAGGTGIQQRAQLVAVHRDIGWVAAAPGAQGNSDLAGVGNRPGGKVGRGHGVAVHAGARHQVGLAGLGVAGAGRGIGEDIRAGAGVGGGIGRNSRFDGQKQPQDKQGAQGNLPVIFLRLLHRSTPKYVVTPAGKSIINPINKNTANEAESRQKRPSSGTT